MNRRRCQKFLILRNHFVTFEIFIIGKGFPINAFTGQFPIVWRMYNSKEWTVCNYYLKV